MRRIKWKFCLLFALRQAEHAGSFLDAKIGRPNLETILNAG
jgi:hypothetical protein